MKKIKFLILTLACVTMMSAVWAQNTPTSDNPKTLSDPTMSGKLREDLSNRNSQLGSTTVDWYDTGTGYYGTYTIGSNTYMTRYDKQGNYLETYEKGDWSRSDVPPSIKSAYSNSAYKDREVTGYWKSSDPDRKGYYMELRDKQGKTSRVWADDQGKFSTTPSMKPTKKPQSN
jgi:hypothetical protein